MLNNAASPSGEASGSSSGNEEESLEPQGFRSLNVTCPATQSATPAKRKRNLPGTPDPNAEVIALSPRTLLATNRFVCEICNKGFQRDQNLQLHRRGHNLPWKLRQRTSTEIRKRVYICPEPTCVHHDPARALGDLTGIKKHYSRKHGEKKWKCDKCSKRYAVQSDWKAHLKTCGTREYRCDCGTLFSRRDSFITHRAFCDALAEENARVSAHQQGGYIEKGGVGFQNNGMGDGFGGPSSPHQADSQLSDGPTNPLSSTANFSKPGMLPDGMPGFPLTECGIASLPSKWIQGGMRASATSLSNKAPGLSLWPGLGPGPGPPGGMGMMGEGIMMPTSRTVNRMSGSLEDFDAHSKLSSGMMPLPSSEGAGAFANLFCPTNSYGGPQGSTSQMASNVLPGFTGMGQGRYGNGGSGGPSSTLSGLSSPSSSFMHQGQHSATPQTSATALLQKAAQMGATTSSPFMFRGFGMGVGSDASKSIASIQRGTKTGTRNEQARPGVGNLFTPPYQAQVPHDVPGGMRSTPGDGSSSVQEFMNSLSGGGMLGGMECSFLGSSSGLRPYNQNADNVFKSHVLGDKPHDAQSDMLLGRSMAMMGLKAGPQMNEDGADPTTVDFLGVGRTSGIAAVTTGIGHTFTQKDFDTLTTLSSGVNMEPFAFQNAACNQ